MVRIKYKSPLAATDCWTESQKVRTSNMGKVCTDYTMNNKAVSKSARTLNYMQYNKEGGERRGENTS